MAPIPRPKPRMLVCTVRSRPKLAQGAKFSAGAKSLHRDEEPHHQPHHRPDDGGEDVPLHRLVVVPVFLVHRSLRLERRAARDYKKRSRRGRAIWGGFEGGIDANQASAAQPLRHTGLVGAIFSLFTQGVTLGFSAAASPGPFQAFLLSRASRARGAAHAAARARTPGERRAHRGGDPARPHPGPAGFLRGLEVAGGAFLLWLAWGAFRTAGERHGRVDAGPAEGAGGSFLRAAAGERRGPRPLDLLEHGVRPHPGRGLAGRAGAGDRLPGRASTCCSWAERRRWWWRSGWPGESARARRAGWGSPRPRSWPGWALQLWRGLRCGELPRR